MKQMPIMLTRRVSSVITGFHGVRNKPNQVRASGFTYGVCAHEVHGLRGDPSRRNNDILKKSFFNALVQLLVVGSF